MSSLIEVDWLPNWVSYTWTRSQSNSTFDDEPLLNHHNLFYLHSPNSENTCCSADFRQACALHCDGSTVCLSCLIRLLHWLQEKESVENITSWLRSLFRAELSWLKRTLCELSLVTRIRHCHFCCQLCLLFKADIFAKSWYVTASKDINEELFNIIW